MRGVPKILNRPGFTLPNVPQLENPPGTAGQPSRHPDKAPGSHIGLALSGGAAAGSFEVGALEYLYDHVFSDPTIGAPAIIAGTSVGSISAAKLAEGGPDSPGGALEAQKKALQELKELWLGLNSESDMYVESNGIRALNERLKKLNDKLAADGVYGVLPDSVVGFLGVELGNMDTTTVLNNLVRRYGVPVGPLVGLWDLASQLEAQAKAEVLDIVLELLKETSLYTLEPIHKKLRNKKNFDPSKIRSSGTELRLAMVGLTSGELRYMDQHGQLLDRSGKAMPQSHMHVTMMKSPDHPGGSPGNTGTAPDVPPYHEDVLIDGVMASATEPVIFGLVRIGDEEYVDGGVREILPAEIAVRDGYHKIYAIQTTAALKCKPAWHPKEPDSKNTNPFERGFSIENVLGRMLDVFLDEIEFSDMRVAAVQSNMEFISPTVDAHGGMTVDPTLIRIGIANGYMRAAEVDRKLESDSAIPTAGQITTMRLEIVKAEHEIHSGGGKVVDPKNPDSPTPGVQRNTKAWENLRNLKKELKQKVEQRLAKGGRESLPDGAQQWWKHWETKPRSGEVGPWVSSA